MEFKSANEVASPTIIHQNSASTAPSPQKSPSRRYRKQAKASDNVVLSLNFLTRSKTPNIKRGRQKQLQVEAKCFNTNKAQTQSVQEDTSYDVQISQELFDKVLHRQKQQKRLSETDAYALMLSKSDIIEARAVTSQLKFNTERLNKLANRMLQGENKAIKKQQQQEQQREEQDKLIWPAKFSQDNNERKEEIEKLDRGIKLDTIEENKVLRIKERNKKIKESNERYIDDLLRSVSFIQKIVLDNNQECKEDLRQKIKQEQLDKREDFKERRQIEKETLRVYNWIQKRELKYALSQNVKLSLLQHWNNHQEASHKVKILKRLLDLD